MRIICYSINNKLIFYYLEYLDEAFVDVPIRKPKVMASTKALLTGGEKGYIVQMTSYDSEPNGVLIRRKSVAEINTILKKSPPKLYPEGTISAFFQFIFPHTFV